MKLIIALGAAATLIAAPAFAQDNSMSSGSSASSSMGAHKMAHKAHHHASKSSASGSNAMGGPTSDQSATPGNTSPQ